MSENQKAVKVSVKGIALYPKKENGVVTYAIRISDSTAKELNRQTSAELGHFLPIHDEKDERGIVTGSKLLNVSTQYNVPVYDVNNNGIELQDNKIYHGAEVIVGITIKEWANHGKTGIKAYLNSFGLIKNGEVKETESSYKSLMGNLINE